jgi:hypothetical protein
MSALSVRPACGPSRNLRLTVPEYDTSASYTAPLGSSTKAYALMNV